MKKLLLVLALAISASSLLMSQVGMGTLYYNGTTVRTVVPPASMPKPGTDDLYVVMAGTSDQLPVAAVAPGNKNYRGGKWAFHSVDWLVTPYVLTSESAVLAAAAAGDVTITRIPANDFKCPIQP